MPFFALIGVFSSVFHNLIKIPNPCSNAIQYKYKYMYKYKYKLELVFLLIDILVIID